MLSIYSKRFENDIFSEGLSVIILFSENLNSSKENTCHRILGMAAGRDIAVFFVSQMMVSVRLSIIKLKNLRRGNISITRGMGSF